MRQVDLNDAPFWDHVEELRRTIIISIGIIVLGILCSLFFYQQIFALLTLPLNSAYTDKLIRQSIQQERILNAGDKETLFILPDNATLLPNSNAEEIAIKKYRIPPGQSIIIEHTIPQQGLVIFGPIDGMLVTLKTCFWIGLVGTSPLWLFFVFRFVAPGINSELRRLILPFVFFSLLFMCLGFYFAFSLTIPIANQYLNLFNANLGRNLWGLSNYIDYTVVLLLGNALAFEVFVIGIFLIHYGKVSFQSLIHFRRYFIVLAFIASALLTPPDVLTQIMLAIPLIALYELSILYGRIKQRRIT